MTIPKQKIIFLLIILTAFILRFYKLGVNPPSLDWDEASMGYNAYSILKTGKDEYGKFLPLSIRSFDDYKPPLYTYLAIPSIAIFGLNEFSVRLPSAIIGVIAVMATYFLVKEFLYQNNKPQTTNHKQINSALFQSSIFNLQSSVSLPLLSSFLLAISPWHLQFSRAAFEANVGLTCVILGTVFFIKALRIHKLFIFSAVFYGLTLYAYHSYRIFTLLLLLALTFIFFKDLTMVKKKYIGFGILIGLIMALPLLIMISRSPRIFFRAAGVSIYQNKPEIFTVAREKAMKDQNNHVFGGELFHSFTGVYTGEFLRGYFNHWDLNWLFIRADNPRHHAPDMGLMYLVELPFLLTGFYFLIKRRSMAGALLLFWFVLAPVPSAPTINTPHAIRSMAMLPVLQIATALGILTAASHFSRKRLFMIAVAALYLLNFSIYFDLYYRHMPFEYAKDWQYGYKELAGLVKPVENNYEKIIVSRKLDQPYIFFLFYLQYDPAEYLREGGTGGVGLVKDYVTFGNFQFRDIKWNGETKIPGRLYIGSPSDFPDYVSSLHNVYYPDGKIFAKIVKS